MAGTDRLLKYQRLHHDLVPDLLTNDRVTSAAIEASAIALGTENGFVHVLGLDGHVLKSSKVHDRAVNSVSVDSSGSAVARCAGFSVISSQVRGALTPAPPLPAPFDSCSDNGSVVVTSTGPATDEKDAADSNAVVLFNQPLKCVCIEADANAKIHKSFIVGGATGQLIYHRTVWFAQKKVALFNGADSPVTAIAWRGNVVAWADATQVALFGANRPQTRPHACPHTPLFAPPPPPALLLPLRRCG